MSDDEALDVWAENMKLEGENDRLRAENEKLREESRSKGERIGGYVNMLVKREAEIEKLRAELKRWEDTGLQKDWPITYDAAALKETE